MGGEDGRGKCALGRGLGSSPQESVIVPLSEHIYSSVSTGRQELSLSHYFKLHLGKLFWGKLEWLGEKLGDHPVPNCPPQPASDLLYSSIACRNSCLDVLVIISTLN